MEDLALDQMMTGKRKVEGESDDYHDYFRNNGQAYINIIVGGWAFGFPPETDMNCIRFRTG